MRVGLLRPSPGRAWSGCLSLCRTLARLAGGRVRIGYARVSTLDQNLLVQVKQLKAAGCTEIFREKVSGAYASRPELRKMITRLRSDDVVIVAKLDRLGRSTIDLLGIIKEIDAAGAGFIS